MIHGFLMATIARALVSRNITREITAASLLSVRQVLASTVSVTTTPSCTQLISVKPTLPWAGRKHHLMQAVPLLVPSMRILTPHPVKSTHNPCKETSETSGGPLSKTLDEHFPGWLVCVAIPFPQLCTQYLLPNSDNLIFYNSSLNKGIFLCLSNKAFSDLWPPSKSSYMISASIKNLWNVYSRPIILMLIFNYKSSWRIFMPPPT